jgi:hypothetical protein
MTPGPRRPAQPLFVGARHAVPVRPARLKPAPIVSLSPLEATLTRSAATTANKGLTRILSSLDATLTKYKGGPL